MQSLTTYDISQAHSKQRRCEQIKGINAIFAWGHAITVVGGYVGPPKCLQNNIHFHLYHHHFTHMSQTI